MQLHNTGLTVVIVAILLLVPVAAFAVPQLPHSFYGTATMNGSPAPSGTLVTAFVDGNPAGSVQVQSGGVYGESGAYDQKLLVQGDDITAGATIEFRIDGNTAAQNATFESGAVEELDLTASFEEQEESSGSSANTQDEDEEDEEEVEETVEQAGDIDGDGVVGVLDFNTMMVSWGTSDASADLNNDGTVDLLDFNTLMVNWTG